MSDWLMRGVAGAIVAAFVVLMIGCEVAIWRECRAAGHSRLMCARLVSR